MASARHSLWGHKLWNASKVLGEMIEEDPSLVKGKNCLELGAGAGLPSLLAALNGAKHVVVSDYASTTDQVLVEAIQMNIDRLMTSSSQTGNNNNSKINIGTDVLSARGYVWGQQIQTLLEPLSSASASAAAPAGAASGFDVIICADLIFNRSEHSKLLWTCKECLVAEGGQVLVAYSHHDPEKAKLDMRFFELAKEEGWVIEDIKVEQCVDLFVENDGLDEERGKVYVKRLTLLPPALNAEQPVGTPMAESKQL
jgi:nicotinamide N-methyltransferase